MSYWNKTRILDGLEFDGEIFSFDTWLLDGGRLVNKWRWLKRSTGIKWTLGFYL